MAKSIFQQNPYDRALDEVEAQAATIPAAAKFDTLDIPEPPTVSMGGPVQRPAQLQATFEQAAVKYDVPVNVLMALAEQESRYNPSAVGTQTQWGRAKGIMQYLDSTAANMGINPYNAGESIDAAAKQLRERLDKGYNMRDAVMEHHAGPDRKLWGPKTRAYGTEVLGRAQRLKGELAPSYEERRKHDPGAQALDRIMSRPMPLTLEEQRRSEDAWLAQENRNRKRADAPDDAMGAAWDILKDSGNLLYSGINSAAEAVPEILGRIPVIGKPIVDAVSRADKFITGKTSQELFDQNRKATDASFSAALGDARKKAFIIQPGDDLGGGKKAKSWALGPAWSDPRAYQSGILESLPEMIVTMGVAGRMAKGVYAGYLARGATATVAANAAARTAMVAGGVTEGLFGGAHAAKGVRDEVMNLDRSVLQESDAYQALIEDGMTPTEARRALAEDAATQGFAIAGVMTGIFGGMGDRALARVVTGQIKGRARQALAGAIGEGVFEELPQSTFSKMGENYAMQDADPNRGLFDGVANEAVSGLVVGGLMGAGMGGVFGHGHGGEHTEEGTAQPGEATPSASDAGASPAPNGPAPSEPPSGPLGRAMNRAPRPTPPADESSAVPVPTPEGTDLPRRVLVTGNSRIPVDVIGETQDAVWVRDENGRELQIPRAELGEGGSAQLVDPAVVNEDLTTGAPGNRQANPDSSQRGAQGNLKETLTSSPLEPGSPAIWANADNDLPVTFLGIAGNRDGRDYARVSVNGQEAFVPADELQPAPGQERAAAPVEDDDPQGLRAMGPGIADGISAGLLDMYHQRASAGETRDASGTPSPILQVAKRVRQRLGGEELTRDQIEAIAREVDAVQSTGEQRQNDLRAIVDRYAPEEIDPETGEVVERAPSQAEPRADESPAKRPTAPEIRDAASLVGKSEAELRERLKYLSQQARTGNGWTKAMTAEKKRISDAIDAMNEQKAAAKRAEEGEPAPAEQPAATATPEPERAAEPQRPAEPASSAQPITIEETPSGKSVIVRGIGKNEEARIREPLPEKALPVWNESLGGWLVSKRHKAKLEAAFLKPAEATPTPAAETPTRETRAPESRSSTTLPRELASAKPRYNFGDRAFELNFESDVDKAAYIAAQENPSKRDADYVAFASSAAGIDEGAVRARGRDVRARVKELARGAKPGVLNVPATENVGAAVAEAELDAATSPGNAAPDPSDAQKEAGNYQKGHVQIGALDISIENPAGTRRRPEWPPLTHTYGYVKGSHGADGDHVDVFLGPDAENTSKPVYVVDQVNEDGSFDEHKVMIGFENEADAREGYLANYERGWTGLGAISPMTFENFETWVKDQKATAKPVGKIDKGNGKTRKTAPEHVHNQGKPLDESTRFTPVADPSLVTQTVELDPKDVIDLTMPVEQFAQVTDEWAALFANPPKVSQADKRALAEGRISLEEAEQRINGWKQHVRDQFDNHRIENSNKTILSLFDYTGEWSRPYEEAGYNVLRFDIQNGQDVMDFSVEWFNDNYDFSDVYGILAATPCTDFASSGARHFAAKDADGRTEASKELVFQTLRTIEYFRPKFWVLENPVGRIERLTGLPRARMSFNPSAFGAPYTKKTMLWGKFNAELPLAPVEATEGSKMHRLYGGKSLATKNARSETPEGFAYAFFMANNYVDADPVERTSDDFPEASGAVRAAFKAGMNEAEIRDVLEQPYGDYEYDQARSDLLRAVADRGGNRPKPRAPREEQAPTENATPRAEQAPADAPRPHIREQVSSALEGDGWKAGPTRDGQTEFTKRLEGVAPAGTVSDGARVITLRMDESGRWLERLDGFDTATSVDLRNFPQDPQGAIAAAMEGVQAAQRTPTPSPTPTPSSSQGTPRDSVTRLYEMNPQAAAALEAYDNVPQLSPKGMQFALGWIAQTRGMERQVTNSPAAQAGWDAAQAATAEQAPAATATPTPAPKPAPKRKPKSERTPVNPHVRKDQKVRFTEQVDYLGGDPDNNLYTVESVGKREAWFVNDATGGRSSLPNWQMQRAIADGKMIVQQDEAPAEEAAPRSQANEPQNAPAPAARRSEAEQSREAWQTMFDEKTAQFGDRLDGITPEQLRPLLERMAGDDMTVGDGNAIEMLNQHWGVLNGYLELRVKDDGSRSVGISDKGRAWVRGEDAPSAPETFIQSPQGGVNFGEITPNVATAIGRQGGKIRLREGNAAWGRQHIEQRHGDQIRKLGFASVEEFVASVATNFSTIYERDRGAMDVVLETGKTGQRLMVKLEPATDADGDYYDVKTASPVRGDQFKNKSPLWERAGTSTPTAQDRSPSPEGQSGSPNVGQDAPARNTSPGERFANNKLFTADKVEAARARLREKMGRLNSGVDPEVLIDGMTIAGAYIESGMRNFSEYARAMREDFGRKITPYLLSFWEGARNYPGLDNKDMTSAEQSAALHAQLLAEGLPAEETAALGTEVAKPKAKATPAKGGAARTLRADWPVDHIDGWTPIEGGKNQDTDDGMKGGMKDAFLSDAVAYLRATAAQLRDLGFEPHTNRKGKAENPVSRNDAGPAVAGDVTMTLTHPATGANVYVTVGASGMRGAVPTNRAGVSLMYRVAKKGGDKYATGSVNRWAPIDLTAADLADAIAKEAGGTAPELARDHVRETRPEVQGEDRSRVSPVQGRGSQRDDTAARPDLGDVGTGEPANVGEPASVEPDAQAGVRGAGTNVAPERRADAAGLSGDGRPGDRGTREADARSRDAGGRDPGSTASSSGRPAVPQGSVDRTNGGARGGRGGLDLFADAAPAQDSPAPRTARVDPAKIEPALPDEPSPARTGPGNFHVADPLKIVGGGPVARFERNRKAIEIFNEIRDEDRKATAEEQEILAGYTGWGSFGQELFQGTWARPMHKDGWDARGQWLRDHMGKETWESAQRSITNAHYTDPPTVMAMWEMLKRMGFKGGRVLEPSMGIGNFFGMMPADVAARSQLAGIEMDELTGGMAQLLYPDATIRVMPYQQSRTPDGFYDVAIGNWPFENTVIADRRYDRLSPLLHDYFFLKTLDQVRPGGIVMGITSSGSMDKKGTTIRRELAKKAELVAAFRLPTGAFAEYAGTNVVTDIVILRKRAEPISLADSEGWINSVPYVTPNGEVSINEYYVHNPSHVIGKIDFGSGTTRGRPGMIVHRPDNMTEQLQRIIAAVPEASYTTDTRAEQISYVANHTDDREGSLTQTDKGLFVVRGEHLAPAEQVRKFAVKSAKTTAARQDQLERLVDMRKKYAALIEAQREGDGTAERKALASAYKAFTKDHGKLSDSYGLDYLKQIDDPFYPALAALEIDGKPATILSRSTTRGAASIENPTIAQAFVLERNQAVNPSLESIAQRAGRPEAEVKAELLDTGAAFELPNGDIIPSDLYLSGNVREKLRQAKAAVEEGMTALERNVEALQEVVPADVPYFKIETQLGATWVSPDIYGQFVAHMLGLPDTNAIEVRYNGGRWTVRLEDRAKNRPEARAGFGTDVYPFQRLVNSAFSNQTVTIRRRDSDGSKYVDQKATEEANGKIAGIREKFGEWLWSDPERRVAVEAEYNETRNAFATPRFDGSFLTFEGMALSLGNGPFDLRKHQADAIWRALVSRRSLNAHEVGTGKTFTMGGIALESRRYGIAKKPLIFAHNANSKSVASEIQMMYPAAKVLFIDNLTPKTIDVKMRQIANDDWDAIVVPHSLIDRFSFREETLMEMAREEIAALEEEAYLAADEDGATIEKEMWDDTEALKRLRSPTAKELVKLRQRIIETVRKQSNRSSREGAISFEELGVDMLMVDEAHEFKKPPISTRMKMKGLNTGTSDRSIALSFLTRYVRAQNAGGNVHLFTGTPVTNTLTEVFHMMRYIMQDEMQAAGVDQWDGWFGSFAREVMDVEQNAAAEYEAVTRLAGFINVPELRRMIGQYMDVVFASDMPEMQPRRTKSGKTMAEELTEAERAELLNGRTEGAKDRPYKKVINVTSDLTPRQKVIFDELRGYARAWRAMSPKQRKDTMNAGGPESPIVTEGLAAKASFDVRLYDGEQLAGQEGHAADDDGSKASRIVANVKEIYDSHPQAAQVIFAEQGFSNRVKRSLGRDEDGNKKTRSVPMFSTIRDMVMRLERAGIPSEQIALVDGRTSKSRREEIAEAMNTGEIRVVIGSTSTLGVGVNMQRNLRAMHHMDAPWMPGDLEQRNGRGQRQGNQWNTVLEYRYLTDRLDGRRWQVLAIKQRFITAFLKADDSARTIEGEAASDEESDIMGSFAEAAGDPRILIREKLRKQLEQAQRSERLYTQGIADARRKARSIQSVIGETQADLAEIARRGTVETVGKIISGNAGKAFSIEFQGQTIDSRRDADEAIQKWGAFNLRVGDEPQRVGTFGGQDLLLGWPPREERPFLRMVIDGKPFNGATVQGLETSLRRFGADVERQQANIGEMEATMGRLNATANEPFHKAEDLARYTKALADLEADIEANPVPPPSWLRTGAPVDTGVFWNGKEFTVTGHRWTPEGWYVLADDERGSVVIPFAEAKDEQGIEIYEPREFEQPDIVEKGSQDTDTGTPEDQPAAHSIALPGKGGFTSAEGLRAHLTGGRLGRAIGKLLGTGKIVLHDTAETLPEINSGRKSPTQSEIDPFYSKDGSASTDSAAFKAWFGKSKVVDGKGRPLAVYHGTRARFTEFDTRKEFWTGPGMNDVAPSDVAFFSDNRKVAGTYGRTMKVYLKMENPLVVDAKGAGYASFVPSSLVGQALRNGHDGVIVNNMRDGVTAEAPASTIYIALDRSRIKSATANDGTFSSSNPDIRRSEAPAGDIQGMTTPDGTIHLVADKLTSRTALPVLLHEMFHAGVRPLIGDKAWQATMTRLEALYRNASAREGFGERGNSAFWAKALDRVERAKPYPGQEVEEFAAYAIENQASAPSGVRALVDRLLGTVKAWALRRFNRQLGAVTPAQLEALAVAALRSNATAKRATAARSIDTGPTDVPEVVADAMLALAENDEMFTYPRSSATSIEGAMADLLPGVRTIGTFDDAEQVAGGPFEDMWEEQSPDSMTVFETANGKRFYAFEKNDRVWIDVSRFAQGDSGSRVYMATAEYALNAGKVFIGDPAGLSDDALVRRTDLMLAIALKHRTTDHIAPHPRQLEGDKALGVPPLKWRKGDLYANTRALIGVSLESLAPYVPLIDSARYDVGSRAFVTRSGKPLADDAVARAAGNARRAGRPSTGSRTVKRALLLKSLLREESGEASRLLERAVFGGAEYVFSPQLADTFYSRVIPSEEEVDLSEPGLVRSVITKAMDGKASVLSTVPLRPLITEMGSSIPAAQEYLDLKQGMDSYRDRWHARADGVAQPWLKFRVLNKAQNVALMDLMHEATLEGVDPAEPFQSALTDLDRKILEGGPDTPGWDGVSEKVAADKLRKEAHGRLVAKWDALPNDAKKIYRDVRNTYRDLGLDFERTLVENLSKALDIRLTQAQRKHDLELDRIARSNMSYEATQRRLEQADAELAEVKRLHGWTKGARMTRLRALFETNRLNGPYFPLARFGNFFVTAKDANSDEVVSFSRFENPKEQAAFAKEMRDAGHAVEIGVLEDGGALKSQVDPRFVVDVEGILEDADAPDSVRDAIWQRWLEQMPDMSVRTNRIHRKGRAGFNTDALRAFANHMFHGSHQIARLKYALDMDEALAVARDQSKTMPDPVRAGLLVNEMVRRHQFVMNPTGGAIAQVLNSAAFVYFLSTSPAAAIVNTAQTAVLGIPILAAYHGSAGAGMARATAELGRALKDFSSGKGYAARAGALNAQERAAMEEAYETGLIERTQSHDIAGVGESGVRYSPVRTKVMGVISWAFHHTERMNREVTFLAAYRMARKKGEGHDTAIRTAADLTWKTHFDYQNTSRPRIMQSDTAKVLLTFRNFQANMLWRLFRDVHQSVKGSNRRARKEAITQLAGTTGMMMLSAGIRGTWLYGIAIMLASALFGDDAEDEFKKGVVDALGHRLGGMALNGVPGDLLGIDLSNRIGMPDLWFRSPGREMEGSAEFDYWALQLLGASVGMLRNVWNGANQINEGYTERGIETAAPKFARDIMRAVRYQTDGVTTFDGDPIMEDVPLSASFKQGLGFMPAELAERYGRNRSMKNREQRIMRERKTILADYDKAQREDADTSAIEERIDRFNDENPDYPIRPKTVMQSMRSRARMRERKVGGVALNPRLVGRLNEEAPELIYSDEE
ncbi:MAG: PLxRFG domain-containing protein [Pseudomonadota bacterium]|nr:PLxRFG domain-containing protein [Pseudomonadota bacterium]